jgi:hypothetical protein
VIVSPGGVERKNRKNHKKKKKKKKTTHTERRLGHVHELSDVETDKLRDPKGVSRSGDDVHDVFQQVSVNGIFGVLGCEREDRIRKTEKKIKKKKKEKKIISNQNT